ncbi:GGDEF-domain containing protein [Colwellia sp. 75C3]|nr:GGDEF-domain containing protein [Colwellia sp. 75C3]
MLFVASLLKNESSLFKANKITVDVSLSALTEPPIYLKVISTILFFHDVYLHKETLVVANSHRSEHTVIIPLRTLFINTLVDLVAPIAALFVVLLTSITCTTLINIKKYSSKLKPACQKVDALLKSFDDNHQEMNNEGELIYLETALDHLKKQTANHKAHREEEDICDKLTKLLDRHAYMDHISREIEISTKTGRKSGLLFVDLDGFKRVNDSFGHSFGDEVLIQVSERLRSVIRSQGLEFKETSLDLEYNLARLGGDEFSIFVQELTSSEEAIRIASNVLQELERDFILGNKNIKISASIGIAIYPDSAATPNALLQMADVAMYRAKAQGRGVYRIYTPEMGSKMRRYHYLLEEIRLAIDSNNFSLNYQPIIHVDGYTISYFEALARWHHSSEGYITPSEFIPIAEDSNLILELGDWVLDEACRQMASWYNAGMKKSRISVNVSGVQLKHRSLYSWVMSSLSKTGLPASSLMIEITESCFIEASKDIVVELEKLRAEGIMIAIDDFGTGFSSLSLLADLPIDILKIDQLFISKAMKDIKYKKILCSIVSMAEQLELKVVAEGIEQIDQLDLLKSLGVAYIQGYLISRPQPSNYVGKKIFCQNLSILAQTGTGVWEPEESRGVSLF